MSTTMASSDAFTEMSFHKDSSEDWSTELPLENSSHFLYRQMMNNSHFFNCPSAGPNSLGRYISMILYTSVCIIGLFGNSLVI